MKIKRALPLVVFILIAWVLQFIGITLVDDAEAYKPYSVSKVERNNEWQVGQKNKTTY